MKAKQFIKDYTNHCSNELCYEEGLGNLYEPWLTPDQALRAVEIAREELIDKVCKWLEEHSHKYMKYHEGLEFTEIVYDWSELVDNLKKYMEE